MDRAETPIFGKQSEFVVRMLEVSSLTRLPETSTLESLSRTYEGTPDLPQPIQRLVLCTRRRRTKRTSTLKHRVSSVMGRVFKISEQATISEDLINDCLSLKDRTRSTNKQVQ